MTQRSIVEIDEEKCNGCGECVPSCAEGAIQLIHGKARLVSDVYCDGLGACLGRCPQGAITIRQREAAPFDEAAAQRHVEQIQASAATPHPAGGCPGTAVRSLLTVLPRSGRQAFAAGESPQRRSGLTNWPVQLRLVPPGAPFLKDADLLLVADCVPAAFADFHGRLLKGQPVALACPKLDDARVHVDKLTAILTEASIRSLTVVHMEVPCCTGLVRIAEAALLRSDCAIPFREMTISVHGAILEPQP